MKLKKNYITQDVDDAQFIVPIGTDSFCGIVRSNRTAAFIVDCLKKDTTAERIIDEMCARYDVPRGKISADVNKVLDTLRKIGALEE